MLSNECWCPKAANRAAGDDDSFSRAASWHSSSLPACSTATQIRVHDVAPVTRAGTATQLWTRAGKSLCLVVTSFPT